jgi:lipopolysaccharide/colanic/teichoic acid biosynthesis glycosyltransferase
MENSVMIKDRVLASLAFIQRSISNKNNSYGIHSSAEFKKRIAAQRNISNRGKYEFSLLVYYTTTKGFTWEPHLFHEITKRVRSVDEIGWIDNQRIGLILPYTSSDGAKKVASLILDAIKDSSHPLEYYIYNHPSRTYYNSDGQHHQMQIEGLFSKELQNNSKKNDLARDDKENITTSKTITINEAPPSQLISKDFHLLSGTTMPIWKRGMDIAGASICLILLSPIMLLTAFAVKISSRGPALFKQDRIGLGIRPFKMYKFRSMIVNQPSLSPIILSQSDNAGPFVLNKTESDPRITMVGRYIRKWSLDELPQLFNVLKGDMSLVGPRPLVREEAEACTDWHESRFSVKPGLTCIWQVNGRSGVKADERSRMDLRYILNFSLAQDLKLLFLTPVAVIRARGAH